MSSDLLTLQALSGHLNTRHAAGQHIEELDMPDENQTPNDQQGQGDADDFPSIDVIWNTWWTTAKAAQELSLTTETISLYCKNGRLRGMKFGREWRVDPESVSDYNPQKTGRPRKSDSN